MIDPLFWLGLSILLVAVSLTAVLVAALPALRELARAARSAEKLFDTLSRELPPTLEAIRLTGMEISDLSDDMSESVQSASRVVQQIDQSISGVKKQAKQAQTTTRSVFAGVKAAWKTFSRPAPSRRRDAQASSRSMLSTDSRNASEIPDRLPPTTRPSLDLEDDYPLRNPSSSRRNEYANEDNADPIQPRNTSKAAHLEPNSEED
ncbi:MAG: DUF948 domain-containing protein [Cyanobacteria bacterium CRU_2_1]|nr:DUF948 domain-containing protein [Cyanobacteria bacterium RU_5_0]NJR63602.1 DUF948 domain-containing protein [Cyanobacteria bacterium CRU_2_1]